MSIQNLLNTQPRADSHRPASRPGAAPGASFQAQLEKTASSVSPLSSPNASAFDRSSLAKNNLLSTLADFQSSALSRMKQAKENEEEQDAWEKLMKYLDAWIASLREEADVEKVARAHAALAALQSDAETDRQDSGDLLLARLTELLAD